MIVVHDYPSGEVRHVLLGGKQYTIGQLLALIAEHAALTAENERLHQDHGQWKRYALSLFRWRKSDAGEIVVLKQERDNAYRTSQSWKRLALALLRRQKQQDASQYRGLE